MNKLLDTLKNGLAEIKASLSSANPPAPAPEKKALDLAAADGRMVHFETDAETFAEGDLVTIDGQTPDDGEITMSDGTKLTITGGKVSAIIDPPAPAQDDAAVNALRQENAQLRAQIAEQETALSEVLNEVKEIKSRLVSKYTVKNRANDFANRTDGEPANRAAEAKERRKSYKPAK